MAYFLLIQAYEGSVENMATERFVCFEADTQSEAIQRAEWFGIDLSERFGIYFSNKWNWYGNSCGTDQPEVAGSPIERSTRQHGGDWIVVYKNGNLRGNRGVPLDMTPEPRPLGPLGLYYADASAYYIPTIA